MAAKMTVGKVRRVMLRLQGNIRALTRRQLRLGKPISYGDFPIPPPNTNIAHVPVPFSGGT